MQLIVSSLGYNQLCVSHSKHLSTSSLSEFKRRQTAMLQIYGYYCVNAKLIFHHFASTLPPTSCIPLSIGICPAVEATWKGGSKICFHLPETLEFCSKLLSPTIIQHADYMNRQVRFSCIFGLVLTVKSTDMELDCRGIVGVIGNQRPTMNNAL